VAKAWLVWSDGCLRPVCKPNGMQREFRFHGGGWGIGAGGDGGIRKIRTSDDRTLAAVRELWRKGFCGAFVTVLQVPPAAERLKSVFEQDGF